MTTDTLLAHLNSAGETLFVAITGPLYEHSPWIAARAWQGRPYADRAALHQAMQQIVRDAPHERHLALIRAHPDLAGKLARAGALAQHSTGEQQGLGLDRLTDTQFELFDRLNTEYRDRFGFPFIIAVRAQTRASVIEAFRRRLGQDRDAEIRTALDEIGQIARFRLDDLTLRVGQLAAGPPGPAAGHRQEPQSPD